MRHWDRRSFRENGNGSGHHRDGRASSSSSSSSAISSSSSSSAADAMIRMRGPSKFRIERRRRRARWFLLLTARNVALSIVALSAIGMGGMTWLMGRSLRRSGLDGGAARSSSSSSSSRGKGVATSEGGGGGGGGDSDVEAAAPSTDGVPGLVQSHWLIRAVLLEKAGRTSVWLREYFLRAEDVTVSSRERLVEILEGWMDDDPCRGRKP